MNAIITTAPKPLTVEAVIETVAARYGISVALVTSKFRTGDLVRARHIAMWLAHGLTGRSYPSIGRAFGYRDHTTVMHAVDKIGEQMTRSRDLRDEVADLQRQILAEYAMPTERDILVAQVIDTIAARARALALHDPDRFLAWAAQIVPAVEVQQ
jgi:hypothetical protein